LVAQKWQKGGTEMMVSPVAKHDNRDDVLNPYRGPFVRQKTEDRTNSPLPPLSYDGKVETLVQSFKLGEGNWIVFAKLNIINPAPKPTPAAPEPNQVSVRFELRVGTWVDVYEMLDISPASMRLASLIVGANLIAEAEGKLVYKAILPPTFPTALEIVNVSIASIKMDELRLF